MVIKIATGKKKGITIASTKSARELRPTQALVRESLINIVRNSALIDLSQAHILDLYAGIGSVGLEFLSNDVASVQFVEKDIKCVKVLRENIRNLGFGTKSKILLRPVLKALEQMNQNNGFDLIFADPPYKFDDFQKIFSKIFEKNLLKKEGLLVWESSAPDLEKQVTELFLDEVTLAKKKKYGATCLYFFSKN